MTADPIVGVRHPSTDGRACLCGCQHVVGLPGRVVQDSDTPKFAKLDPPMLVAEFDVPSAAGGPARTQQVAYTYADLGQVSAETLRVLATAADYMAENSDASDRGGRCAAYLRRAANEARHAADRS